MQITLNITKKNVKRVMDLVLSIAFILCGSIFTIIFLSDVVSLNNSIPQSVCIAIRSIFYAITITYAIYTTTLTILTFIRKTESNYPYSLSAGYAIGVGFSTMIATLIIYPIFVIFTCCFFIIPLLVYVLNTTIWHLLLKNNNTSFEYQTDRIDTLIDGDDKISIFSSTIVCGLCSLALLTYFICGGKYWSFYLYFPIVFVAPVFIVSLVISLVSFKNRKQSSMSWLFLGLCVGLSWILGSQLGFDSNSLITNNSTNIALSYTAFGIILTTFTVWLVLKIIKCIKVIKTMFEEHSNTKANLQEELQSEIQEN